MHARASTELRAAPARARRSTSSPRRASATSSSGRASSTNLKRGDGDESVRATPRVRGPAGDRRSGGCADDLGRRYAAVSGDHNPIHLHDLAAKPFGFPRAIAHGMWTKARCLAALRLPDAFTVDVRFSKPILLPSTVTFGSAEDDAATRFAVRAARDGVPHLDGHVEAR